MGESARLGEWMKMRGRRRSAQRTGVDEGGGRQRCANCQLNKLGFQVGLVSLEYSRVLDDFYLIFLN